MKGFTKKQREEKDPRTVEVKTPFWLLAAWGLACALLLAGMFYSVFSFQRDFAEARMTGVITGKHHEPKPPEKEITIGKTGVVNREVDGEYTLTVSVQEKGGQSRDFTVWVPKILYDKAKEGDLFDVGPYLLPDGKKQGKNKI